MIVRFASAAVTETKLDGCVNHICKNVIPKYEGMPGFLMVWLLQRQFVAYVELVLLSIWKTEEEMNAFVASQPPDPILTGEGVIQMEARTYELSTSHVGYYTRSDPPGT